MSIVRPTIPTKEVVTPDTGITVILKSKQLYGDKISIYNSVFGDVQVNASDPAASSVTFAQAFQMAIVTLTRMIVSWDVTEEDGSPITIDQANIESILTEGDVDFLMNQTRTTEDDKKK